MRFRLLRGLRLLRLFFGNAAERRHALYRASLVLRGSDVGWAPVEGKTTGAVSRCDFRV
jgi:hypothetical protein